MGKNSIGKNAYVTSIIFGISGLPPVLDVEIFMSESNANELKQRL